MGVLVLLVYILGAFASGHFILENERFTIAIPLSESVIKGDYRNNVIVTICLTLGYYVIFLFVVSQIFKTFKAKVLFTERTLKQLRYFALLNLAIGPSLYFLIHFIIMNHTNFRDLPNLLLSLFLGICTLFIIEVFKNGFNIQSENDLTI